MRTVRYSSRLGGGSACQGGICLPGECLPGTVSACPGGVCLPGGVSAQGGVHLPRGLSTCQGVSARGCLPAGGVCLPGSLHLPPPWTDRHLWKHNLSATTVADGNKPNSCHFKLLYYGVLEFSVTSAWNISSAKRCKNYVHKNSHMKSFDDDLAITLPHNQRTHLSFWLACHQWSSFAHLVISIFTNSVPLTRTIVRLMIPHFLCFIFSVSNSIFHGK